MKRALIFALLLAASNAFAQQFPFSFWKNSASPTPTATATATATPTATATATATATSTPTATATATSTPTPTATATASPTPTATATATATATPTATPAVLTYVSDGDANGVFNWIGTRDGSTTWSDPQSGIRPLVVTASGVLGGSEEQVVALSDRVAGHFYTTNVANSYVVFDLGAGRALVLNAYTYRSRSGFNGDHPTAWKLEGSNNGTSWTLIDTQSVSFSSTDQWLTTPVAGQVTAYRYFKWTSTGLTTPNSNNYFVFGEAELYGTLYY